MLKQTPAKVCDGLFSDFVLLLQYHVCSLSMLTYIISSLTSSVSCLDPDLDQYVANHPFTGTDTTVGGAQFAGTTGSWLLPEPI